MKFCLKQKKSFAKEKKILYLQPQKYENSKLLN